MANGKKKKRRTGDAPLVADGGPFAARIGGPLLRSDASIPGALSAGPTSGWVAFGAKDRRTREGEQSGDPARSAPGSATSAPEEFHWYGSRPPGPVPVANAVDTSRRTGISDAARQRLGRIWSIPVEQQESGDVDVAPDGDGAASRELDVDWAQPATAHEAGERRAEELELLTSMAAGIERIALLLEAVRVSIGQVRDWTTAHPSAELAERSLGRLVIDAELLVERGIEDAEQRARAIVAAAKQQAESILGAPTTDTDGGAGPQR